MDRRILSRSLRRNEPIGLFQRNAWAVGRVAGTLRADALVVPLGLDAFEGDPFGGGPFFTLGFAQMAEAISGVGLLMLAER